MTSYLRHAAKSDLKALSVVRDLSEKKKHTFSSFFKICLSEVRLGMFILVFRFDSDSQMIRNLFLILLNRNTRAKFLGSTALYGK